MQKHLFLLCSSLLLLLLLSSNGGRCQKSTPTPTHTPGSSPSPSKTPTPTSSSEAQGQAVNGPTWSDNIATTMENLFGALTKTSSGRNSSAALAGLLSRLPGMFQGRGGNWGSSGGNDVGQVLASLFADPRTHNTPAWIEALIRGSNSSQGLQSAAQQLLQMFGQQGFGQQLQTLLSHVFSDVLQGLSSLHLSPSSSPQEILTAILSDPSLMSSMSSVGQTMLKNLSSQAGLQNMLMEALKQQFPVDLSSQCAADLSAMGQGILQGQMWTLRMLDAMGKIPPGIFEGFTTLFGDFDECSAISHTDQSHTIEGLFCGMAIKGPDQLARRGVPVIGLHLCLPSSCTEAHRYQMVQPTLKSIGSQYYGQYCYRPRKPSGDNRFTGVVITFALLGALCAIGTIYGAVFDHNTKKRQAYELERANANTYTNQAYVSETMADAGQNGGHVVATSSNENAGNVNGKITPPPPYVSVATVGGPEASKLNGSQSVALSEAPSKPKECLGTQLLLSFSVLRNGRKLLACHQNPNDVSCLHGIRVLSIVWVIVGHCFTQLGSAQANSNATVVLLRYFTYAAIPGALLSVDTFFLLSGCLTAFLFLKSTKKSGLTVSAFILYYFHRIWRLTPLYGLMLAYYIGIFPYTKRGPFENLEGMDSEGNCRKTWYYNILYVNNIKDEDLCFGWSWYLSNDMQFSVIAPIILIPWVLRGKLSRVGDVIGCLLAFSLIVVHSVTSGVIIYRNDFSMFKNTGEYMDKVYFTPWCRVGPYAVGLLLGFILYKTPRSYRMSKMAVLLGWFLAWAVGLTLVYVNYDNLRDLMHGARWNTAQTAAYEALAKWLWAVCVAWVIFACYTGYGGFINSLLSWSAWAPLSRLTYGVYLIHMVVIFTLTGNHKNKLYLDGWTATELTLAVTVLSYMASFIFSMLIEAPTLGLEKAVLGKIFKKKRS